MRHFVAYHNTAKMGHAYTPPTSVQTVLSNKPVQHLLGETVWVITYEESAGSRNYVIAGFFDVTSSGDTNEGPFRHFVSGKGRVFRPAQQIDQKLIGALLKATGNFAFGLQEIKDRGLIEGLEGIAARSERAARSTGA